MAKKEKKVRPSSSGILLFIAAFVGALALCAGIGYAWWRIAEPDVSWLPFSAPDAADAVATTPSSTRYDATDRVAMAVYLTDDSGVLQTASLVLICPDTAQVAVCGMPAELSLSADETDTLSRRLRLGGVNEAQSALSRYFEVTIDHYLVVSYADAEGFLEALGIPLIVDLPTDINEQNDDGSFAVHLTAGENALSAKQVSNLLRCTNFQDGRRERAAMHARVIQAYLAQFMSSQRSWQSDYALLASYADVSLGASQFVSLQPRLEYILAEKDDGWLPLIPTTGDFSGVGATLRFTPDGVMSQAIVIYLPDDTVKSEMAE